MGSSPTFSTVSLFCFHNVNSLARGLNLANWDIAGRSSKRLLISGCKFDSYYPSNIGMYISWLDSHPDKVEVIGSSPIIPTVVVAQWVERQVVVLLVMGSSPIYHPISS